MSQNEANGAAELSELCGHGVPVRFVCSACVEDGGRRMAGAVFTALADLDAPAPVSPDADVLAYLARRRGNAERVAGATVQSDPLHELARDRARQLDVLIDEIRAGLHHGEAAAQAQHTGFAAEVVGQNQPAAQSGDEQNG